jgi:hypothetical protein
MKKCTTRIYRHTSLKLVGSLFSRGWFAIAVGFPSRPLILA